MARIASVCLVSFLLALVSLLGLEVYSAKHPGLDGSGLLSSVDPVARVVPSGRRMKHVVGARTGPTLKGNCAGRVAAHRGALQPETHFARVLLAALPGLDRRHDDHAIKCPALVRP